MCESAETLRQHTELWMQTLREGVKVEVLTDGVPRIRLELAFRDGENTVWFELNLLNDKTIEKLREDPECLFDMLKHEMDFLVDYEP